MHKPTLHRLPVGNAETERSEAMPNPAQQRREAVPMQGRGPLVHQLPEIDFLRILNRDTHHNYKS